jgi:hypothetical protein
MNRRSPSGRWRRQQRLRSIVDVPIELRAAAGHPDMKREHVVMLAGRSRRRLTISLRLVVESLSSWLALAAFFRMAKDVIISRG